MNAAQVEKLCDNLTDLIKHTIRTKILKPASPDEYSFHEALVFWLADWLYGSKLLQVDQLRLILEEFLPDLEMFGNMLETVWRDKKDAAKLPVCKLGFLDRKLACMDNDTKFLDLYTGEKTTSTNKMPLEVISYNLTTLFVKYHAQYQAFSSAELKLKEQS